jgi:hypothetical protein
VPLKRPGSRAEVGPIFVTLASDEASYVSGARVAVTGGSLIYGTPEKPARSRWVVPTATSTTAAHPLYPYGHQKCRCLHLERSVAPPERPATSRSQPRAIRTGRVGIDFVDIRSTIWATTVANGPHLSPPDSIPV